MDRRVFFKTLLSTFALASLPAASGNAATSSSATAKFADFNDILRNGKIEAARHSRMYQKIEWDRNDEFIKTYKRLLRTCIDYINKDKDLQALLSKGKWIRGDRRQWEQGICTLVSGEVHKVPGFKYYRDLAIAGPHGKKALYRPYILNDLSYDIKNGTCKYEFDCETQSAFKGCLVQDLENHFLKKTRQDKIYKRPWNYFMVSGKSNSVDFPHQINNHRLVVTPACAIYECTINATSYVLPANPDLAVENLWKGEPFVADKRWGSIYGTNLTLEQVQQLRQENYTAHHSYDHVLCA